MSLDFSACRIAVVGDLVLDRYLEGSVGRLSPEAPVAVLSHKSERDILGGAANVAANLAALGAQVALVGVIGRDAAGRRLAGLIDEQDGLSSMLVVMDGTRPTTSKTRVMSGLYQFVRIDSESSEVVGSDVEEEIVRAVRLVADWADVIVLSDYAKGVCSDRVIRAVVDEATRRSRHTVIDPKREDFSIYRGATLIKPNKNELAKAAATACATLAQTEAAARAMVELTGAEILLTRSEEGMSYFARGIEALHVPTGARDVFDVSGAGDTVAALAALGLAARISIVETMRLANLAAGVVVGKIGTAVVTLAELDAAVGEDGLELGGDGYVPGALLDLTDAVARRKAWGRMGLRVGFTNGCYDLLHPGHVALLKVAADACDRLIVAVNTDASVKRLKGPARPVQDAASRAAVLGALRAVALVVLFDEDTPAQAIAALQPDLLVKGADYLEHQVVGADLVRARGGEVMLVPLVAGQSTTAMIRRRAG